MQMTQVSKLKYDTKLAYFIFNEKHLIIEGTWARITTTIVYSKNIHVSQCDGIATIFHLCLILTTILCRNNIHFV